MNLTQHLKKALALIDVRFLNHIIMMATDTVSLAERGRCDGLKIWQGVPTCLPIQCFPSPTFLDLILCDSATNRAPRL